MKKLILLLMLGSLFGEEVMNNKYLSTNINILSGDYASINYGNLNKNILNFSGKPLLEWTSIAAKKSILKQTFLSMGRRKI